MTDYLVSFKVSLRRGGPEFIREYRVVASSKEKAVEQALSQVRQWYPHEQVGLLSVKYWDGKWSKVKMN